MGWVSFAKEPYKRDYVLEDEARTQMNCTLKKTKMRSTSTFRQNRKLMNSDKINMGWVSFAKEPYKRDYVLQTRPVIAIISIWNGYDW